LNVFYHLRIFGDLGQQTGYQSAIPGEGQNPGKRGVSLTGFRKRAQGTDVPWSASVGYPIGALDQG